MSRALEAFLASYRRDPEGTPVYDMDLTVEQVRNDTDDCLTRINDLLDEAQGEIFMGEAEASFLIIRISKTA